MSIYYHLFHPISQLCADEWGHVKRSPEAIRLNQVVALFQASATNLAEEMAKMQQSHLRIVCERLNLCTFWKMVWLVSNFWTTLNNWITRNNQHILTNDYVQTLRWISWRIRLFIMKLRVSCNLQSLQSLQSWSKMSHGVWHQELLCFGLDGVTIMRPTTIQRRGYKQEAFESHFESKFERLKARWNPVEVWWFGKFGQSLFFPPKKRTICDTHSGYNNG